MSSNPSPCPEPGAITPRPEARVADLCRAAGAVAVGFAAAAPVAEPDCRAFLDWLAAGRHGSMSYMQRYVDRRLDPRLLFPGAATVISMAFPYRPAGGYHHQLIADYALGLDYHYVIKDRLRPVIDALAREWGARSQICVDTVPILERYWAVRAGVGFVGRNHQLIVPGVGSGVFLAEIVTTLYLQSSQPCDDTCGDCGRCIAACPVAALSSMSDFDATRCMSYLTIEYRGPLSEPVPEGRQVYGCDICARVCPHNRCEPPAPLPEFAPDPRLLTLDRATLANISRGDFRRLFQKSAIFRISNTKMNENSRN